MAVTPKQVEKIKKIAETNRKGKVVKAEVPANSKGKPLDKPTRVAMEEAFGANFSKVRIHTGPEAKEACKALGAKAFTHGSNIFLAGNKADAELLAHELTHVVQQGGRGAAGKVLTK